MSSPLYDPLVTTPEVSAALDDRARLGGMLRFEAALARAEASVGVIPRAAAERIVAACDPAGYDLAAIGAQAAEAGNVAIPAIAALIARVRRDDAEAAEWVHFGATSQDAIDTGFVLQLRRALAAWRVDLAALETDLIALAERESRTPIVGRTWLQHAVPTSFGRKVAGWLAALSRSRRGLDTAAHEACVLQFGGAVGTLAVLGNRALAVSAALGGLLDLPVPPAPWHAERDRFTALACALGILVGTLGKIARDLSLLAQSEVLEIAEPHGDGRGASSTMPQKRNPIGSAATLTAAARVPGLVATMLFALPQEHERGLASWQAEWETLPQILRVGAGALRSMRRTIEGLHVDRERMRERLSGEDDALYAEAASYALARHVGRARAKAIVSEAAGRAGATKRRLLEVLAEHAEVRAHLGPAELAAVFDPEPYVDAAATFVHRVLATVAPARDAAGGA